MSQTEIKPFPEEFDEQQDIARSRFADMLHDTDRNQKYYLGLEAAINKMHERGLKANVLDIGTGTGLLSMMSVKLGADSVTACEAFEAAANCALKIIEDNGMRDKIKLIKKRSTDIRIGEDMEFKANILVTEVFDTELIGEGAIEIFNHAHENLLETDCLVVPDHAVMYVQIVESALVNAWNKVKSIADLDGETLLKTPKSVNECLGEAAVHDLQLSQLGSFRTLTPPTPVFTFDFSGKTKLEKNRKTVTKVKCVQSGLAQAVFMWWELKMDADHKINLSCAPYWAHPDLKTFQENSPNELPQNCIPWRDHWLQAIYYLPKNNNLLGAETEVDIVACHDEYSLWFDISTGASTPAGCRPSCTCGLHLSLSRTKIGQLNDNHRNKKFLAHFENLNLKNSTVLVMNSKCSLLGLAVSAMKPNPNRVIVVEKDKLLRQLLDEYIEQNKLWNVNVKENIEKIDLSTVTHLLFDPSVASTLLWDDFEIFTFLRSQKNKFQQNLHVTPSRAVLKGISVQFLNLHKIKVPVKSCEGFSMETYDKMISKAFKFADDPMELHPLWEYPCRAFGDVQTLLDINLNEIQPEYKTTGVFKAIKENNCNGIVFWMEWQLNESPRSIVSTGPVDTIEQGKYINWTMNNRQGVHLFDGTPDQLSWEFKYDVDENSVQLEFK